MHLLPKSGWQLGCLSGGEGYINEKTFEKNTEYLMIVENDTGDWDEFMKNWKATVKRLNLIR